MYPAFMADFFSRCSSLNDIVCGVTGASFMRLPLGLHGIERSGSFESVVIAKPDVIDPFVFSGQESFVRHMVVEE